jgi:hypothetical protein
MKKIQTLRSISLFILIAGLMTFIWSLDVAGQDSIKSSSKKGVVVIKIKKDDNGKTTLIDTTFNITTPEGHKEFEEFMEKHEGELENLGKELKNIEIMVDMPGFPDSIAGDSEMKHLELTGKDIRCPHFRWRDKPEGCDYEFDFQCPPDVDFPPFQEYEDFEGNFRPGNDLNVFRYNNKRQSLSDIIGDIPMDRVKSYSIKDRKNGKRIIIDIEDAPLLDNHEKVIIIRKQGRK